MYGANVGGLGMAGGGLGMVGGSDSDDGLGGFAFGGGGFGMQKAKPDNRIKEFCGEKIKYVKLISRWCTDNHCSSVYGQRFKRGPMFPLMYQEVPDLEIIDYHTVTDGDGNACAEKGAYDKETGALVIGIRIVSIKKKIDEEKELDEDNTTWKEELFVGEFQNGKLHGQGRKYTESWYYDEGTFEEGKLKEGELTINYECDDYRCTAFLHTDDEKKDQMRIYYGTLDAPSYYEMNMYQNQMKHGVYISYNREGEQCQLERYEKDTCQDAEMRPTEEEAEATFNRYLADPTNKKLADWIDSNKDIREYYGLPRNPIALIKLLANKYEVVEELKPYKEYVVIDTENKLEKKTYLLYYYEEKFDYEYVLDLYKKYKILSQSAEEINKVIDCGVHTTKSIEETSIYYIIVESATNTLREIIEKKGQIEQISKLNFIIAILKEFEKFQRLGFSINNINPDTIILNKEKDTFYFSQFMNATKFMMKSDKYHQYDVPTRKRAVLFSKEQFMKKPDPKIFTFMSRNQQAGSSITKKDDLDSILYVIWWIYSDQKLPWNDMDRSEMDSCKYNMNAEKMCDIDVDDDFYTFINYIYGTSYDRRPNYEFMIDKIRTIQDKYALPRDDKRFCWNLSHKISDKLALKFAKKGKVSSKEVAISLIESKKPLGSKASQSRFFGKSNVEEVEESSDTDFEQLDIDSELNLEEETSQMLDSDQIGMNDKIKENVEQNLKDIEEFKGSMKQLPEREFQLKTNQVLLSYKNMTLSQNDWAETQNENCEKFILALVYKKNGGDSMKILKKGDDVEGDGSDLECEDQVPAKNLKELMEIPEYQLYGQMKIVNLVEQQESLSSIICFRCTVQIKEEQAWRNDNNFLCFTCHPDASSFNKLISELNHNREKPNCFQEFLSDDYQRVHCVLNQAGGDFSYKGKDHKYTYQCVQLNDWQIKMNTKRRILKCAVKEEKKEEEENKEEEDKNGEGSSKEKKEEKEKEGEEEHEEHKIITEGDELQWEKIVSNPNCHIHGHYKNVAVTFLNQVNVKNAPVLDIFKNAEDKLIRVSVKDKNQKVYSMYVQKKNFQAQIFSPDQSFKPCLEYSQEDGELRFDKGNNSFMGLKLHPIKSSIFQKTWLLPTTSVYRSEKNADHYKQVFGLFFDIGKCMMQSFEIEVEWNKKGACCLNVINVKFFFNMKATNVVSNLTSNGIDGFIVFDEKWYSFRRSKPFQFSFKSAVSYNRYAKYYETEESGSMKYWYLESQLTDKIVKTQDNTARLFYLLSNIRTLCNMVPGKIRYFDIAKYNWLQPLELLGGRSLSQFFIGSKLVSQKIDLATLRGSKKDTIIDSVQREFSFSENEQYLEAIKYFKLEAHEMCYDFNYRTAIHDCLDFENMALVQDFRTNCIQYLEEIYFDSEIAREIMTGLFGLILEMADPIPEFETFINDVGEDKSQRAFTELRSDDLPVTSNDDFLLILFKQLHNLGYDEDKYAETALGLLKDDQKKGYVKVNHFVSDWNQSFIQSKLQMFLTEHDEQIDVGVREEKEKVFDFFQINDGFTTIYDIAVFTQRINNLYGGEIEVQKCIKLFIDSQFKDTRRVIFRLFGSYFLLFALPFGAQMFSDNSTLIYICNSSCLLTQIVLMVIESLQVKYYGWAAYFQDYWNYFDIAHMIVYIIYFIFRICLGNLMYLLPIRNVSILKTAEEQIKAIGEIESEQQVVMLWAFIHCAMMVIITFKLMFFMRVSETFSSLVKLINNVMAQVGPFTIFFMMWLITLCLMYRISGITLVEGSEDYPQVNTYFALLMQNFRNSIGDITTPQHSYWWPSKAKHLIGDAKLLDVNHVDTASQIIMTYWGWTLFIVNEFFILIILLNFLIAIIGQSYDEVMSKAEIDQYQSRCDLNIEVAIILDTLREWTHIGVDEDETNRIFYLVANTYHKDDENEFQGFVRTIKMAIKRQNKILKEDIKKCFPNADLLNNFADKFSTISNLDYTVERKMDDVKRELNARMNDLNEKLTTQIQDSKKDILTQIQNLVNEQKKAAQKTEKNLKKSLIEQPPVAVEVEEVDVVAE